MAIRLATFSIAARDPAAELFGTAVSTKVPAVGSLCPFIRHGVGAVCTQAWVNPSLGPRILDRLAAGDGAERALETVMGNEVDREIRQVGVVDSKGRAAAFTGSATTGACRHPTGPGYATRC